MNTNANNIPDCKFKIDQRVNSPIGVGTVLGVFRLDGEWYATVRYDGDVMPNDPIPEPHPFTVYCNENLLKPVEEKK